MTKSKRKRRYIEIQKTDYFLVALAFAYIIITTTIVNIITYQEFPFCAGFLTATTILLGLKLLKHTKYETRLYIKS